MRTRVAALLALVLLVAPVAGTLPLGAQSPGQPAGRARQLPQSGASVSCIPRFSAPELVLELDRDTWPFTMAAADFNDDGLEDVVVARARWKTTDVFELDVLVNDGQGGLVDGTQEVFSGPAPRVQHPRELVIADFNGDGRPDIFVADHGQDTEPFPRYQNSLVLSAPGGRMIDATGNLPQQRDFSHSAAAADIDLDGDTDLCIGNHGMPEWTPPQIWLNDGTGRFTVADGRLPAEQTNMGVTNYESAEFVDVDNDTDPDLVLGGTITWWGQKPALTVLLLNDGTGRFAVSHDAIPPKPMTPAARAEDVKAIDISGDGYQDLIIAYTLGFYEGRYVQVLINNRNDSFRDETSIRMPPQTSNSDPWARFLQILDLDYDGDADIVAEVMGGEHLMYLNDGQGHFALWEHSPTITSHVFTFVDLDGNGRRDIVRVWGPGEGIPERYETFRDSGCPVAFLPVVQRAPCAAPTPTSIPLFPGVAQIYPTYEGMDGWGWPPNARLTVEFSSADGSLKDSVVIDADAQGMLPWTALAGVREGDQIRLTLNQHTTSFDVRMVRATADPVENTIVGTARCYARVRAAVEHPEGTYTSLETIAGPDGHFAFDFTPRVDWDFGDRLWVGQYLNANGLVQITENSPELQIIGVGPTRTATPTPSPTPTPPGLPPGVEMDGPDEAVVGEEITVRVSTQDAHGGTAWPSRPSSQQRGASIVDG